MRDYRGTVSTPDDTSSGTFRAERTHRERIEQKLLRLGGWLAEHPRTTLKNLKPMRGAGPLEPGVYYNQGTGVVERIYSPQRRALGSKMFRVSSDPAAPVAEIRRKIMEGR
jgi:hypothetical protein